MSIPPQPQPIGYVKDTAIQALQKEESTVLLYPKDYLIRPSVAVITVEQAIAYARACVEAAKEIGK